MAVRGGTRILVVGIVLCNNGLGEDLALAAESSPDDPARIRPGNVGNM